MYRVYLITNLVNNKKYIGITHNTIEHRFEQPIQKSRCKCAIWILHRVLRQFDNAKKAAIWIVETQNRTTKPDTVRGAIVRHCMGIAYCQTAYGYKWKWKD